MKVSCLSKFVWCDFGTFSAANAFIKFKSYFFFSLYIYVLAEAGACSVENKEWQIGCDHCYCRNQSVFCETDPGCQEKK